MVITMNNERLDGFDEWFGGTDWRFDFEHKLVSMWNGERWVPIDRCSSIEPITIHFNYTEEPGVIEDLFGCFFDDQAGDEENE